MEWAKEISINELSLFTKDKKRKARTTKRLDFKIPSKNCISLLAEFFITPGLPEDDFVVSIPITNKQVYDTVIDELTPHFNKIMGGFERDKLLKIYLSSLKESSRLLMENKIKHPIIQSLYGHTININHFVSEKELFIVDTDKIPPYIDDSFSYIIDFINKSFIKNSGIIILQPSGWNFNANLIDEIALRYFAQYFKVIIAKKKISLEIDSIILQ